MGSDLTLLPTSTDPSPPSRLRAKPPSLANPHTKPRCRRYPGFPRCGAPKEGSPRRQPWGPCPKTFQAPEGRQKSGSVLTPKPSVAPAGAGSSLGTGTQRSRAGLPSVGAPHLLRLTATCITGTSAPRCRNRYRRSSPLRWGECPHEPLRVPLRTRTRTQPEGRYSYPIRSLHLTTTQAPTPSSRSTSTSTLVDGPGRKATRSPLLIPQGWGEFPRADESHRPITHPQSPDSPAATRRTAKARGGA